MKRKLCVATATILTILLLHGSAFAGGWGPYFSWGREEPTAGYPEFLIDETIGQIPDQILRELAKKAMEGVDVDFQFDHFTIGVMYESAPLRDKLLSYRGTLGLNIAKAKVAGITIPSLSFSPPYPDMIEDVVGLFLADVGDTGLGFSTKHTLAFGIIRTDRLKWWAGPGIGLSFNYYDVGGILDLKAANLSVGGGGETGVNIHLGSSISLCLSGGIHWNAFGYAVGSDDVGSFVWGDGPLYFIQTSVLFRTGDDRS